MDTPAEKTTIALRIENGKDVLHIQTTVRFTNYGFRRGHIDRVEVVRDGVSEYPQKVEVLYVDKTDLGWLEEKAVRLECIVWVEEHNFTENITRTFKVYFYGPTGNEIYNEKMIIRGFSR